MNGTIWNFFYQSAIRESSWQGTFSQQGKDLKASEGSSIEIFQDGDCCPDFENSLQGLPLVQKNVEEKQVMTTCVYNIFAGDIYRVVSQTSLQAVKPTLLEKKKQDPPQSGWQFIIIINSFSNHSFQGRMRRCQKDELQN